MDTKDINDMLSLIPKGLYDPSELVLIGSHVEPSPEGRPEDKESDADGAQSEGSDPADPAKAQEKRLTAKDARRTGHLRVRSDFAISLSLTAHPVEVTKPSGAVENSNPTIALIYAYGYEGHTYRLSKPRIMIVRGNGEPYEAGRDTNDSRPVSGKLYMWRLSKHQHTISIEVESGELEKLVLEANQPGNRSVNSYAAHMQMSHRGGKLS